MSSYYGSGNYGGGGNYRGGGYGGGYNRGGYSGGLGKINEDDVPQSQHAIFVRGLPSTMTTEEIKSFFEDNVGPCSFDFQKINHERESLFVAIRFESKDHAKTAYNRYRHEDILGCRCEVSWFRDIRRYIQHQRETGGTIRRGNFGRGYQANRYQHNDRGDYRKRRHSDDRRSRSYSSDSDRSRSRSRGRKSSRSSRSRSRSSSRESDRRRPDSRDEKRKEEKKKVVKKSKKERRSRRSESRSSRSEGERSRSSSRSDRDESKKRGKGDRRDKRAASPTAWAGSPIRLTPPPPAPALVEPSGPLFPAATTTTAATSAAVADPIENSAPLRITIANKTTVPVENTSFKMALDSDDPPRKIVRGPQTPEQKDDDAMDLENSEQEIPSLKGTPVTGGGPPPHAKTMATPNPPPRGAPTGTPSSAPPPGRPSAAAAAGGGATVPGVSKGLAAKCPEMSKTIGVIKTIQEQLLATVRPNTRLSLSDLSSGESMLEKMEERERQIRELDPSVKNKFDMRMKQMTNSYRGDAQTITTVVKSLVQKDPSLEDQIKPALLSVLEDVEKQIYKKVDDFLVCGM